MGLFASRGLCMSIQRYEFDDPIGVIADTHGALRDQALEMLEGCGLIVHLGDVGSRDRDAAILERLGELAPV